MRAARTMIAAAALALLAGCATAPPGHVEAAAGAACDQAAVERELGATLDALHAAASRADGPAYFGLFTPDAVFIGTDATERWTLPEFRAYAAPHFAQGKGWTYRPRVRRFGSRHACADVAWFDEILDSENYGTSRGTGVLVRGPGGWRVAQYALTFPIPNDLAKEFTGRIKAHEAQARPGS